MKPFDKCPFCQDDMEIDNFDGLGYKYEEDRVKLACQGKDDHTFIHTYYISTNEVDKITCRVGPGETRYYILIDFKEKVSAIWSGRYNSGNHIDINSIIQIDFSKGLEETKKKIKTLLTFS